MRGRVTTQQGAAAIVGADFRDRRIRADAVQRAACTPHPPLGVVGRWIVSVRRLVDAVVSYGV